MHGRDRFLIAIVAGIVLVLAASIAVVLVRRQPTYRSGDTPEAAAHNYLLALRREDYARAYGYLSPTLVRYPAGADEFANQVRIYPWSDVRYLAADDTSSLAVESIMSGVSQTTVRVRETSYYEGGLFDPGESSTLFDMTLVREEGGWKITNSERYWNRCWGDRKETGCP
jgi:hypothetical protein